MKQINRRQAVIFKLLLAIMTLGVFSALIVLVYTLLEYATHRTVYGEYTYRIQSRDYDQEQYSLDLRLDTIGKTTEEIEDSYVNINLEAVNFPVSSYQKDDPTKKMCVDEVSVDSFSVYTNRPTFN